MDAVVFLQSLKLAVHWLKQSMAFGDWFSLISLVVTLLGFGFTIWQLIRVKSAADTAMIASMETRRSMLRQDVSRELAQVLQTLNEIIRMNLEVAEWRLVAQRYASARQALTKIRRLEDFSDEQLSRLTSATAEFSRIESNIDKFVCRQNGREPSRVNANSALREHIDSLSDVQTFLERKLQ